MNNEASLMIGLRENFESYLEEKVRFEDLELCDQVGLVHTDSVVVFWHLWITACSSVVAERGCFNIPYSSLIGNPTSQTLVRYKKSTIAGSWGKVHAHVGNVITLLDKLITGQTNSSNAARQKVTKHFDGLQFPHRLGIL